MSQTAFILIVTDDDDRGHRLGDMLREKRGHACSTVTSLADALDSLRTRPPDVVVAEPEVAGRPAVAALGEQLERVAQDAALLVLGALPARVSLERVKLSALDPAADVGELVRAIDAAAEAAAARRADRLLRETLAQQRGEAFEGIIGVSPAIRRIVEQIRKAAPSKMTVLIIGETGTGKDLIAHAIHRQSSRARKPFKPVNCAAISESLLDSELFGHAKGAFTGAIADHKGYFAAADGGTLFLDEVGDMPIRMQAKLLRALDHREITPVGSTEVQKIDVRIIAATNRNLRELVDRSEFREDLFYRFHQWEIRVPPLRDRRQDVPLLVDHFVRVANEEHGMRVPGVSSEAMAALTRYHWPGNVRELNYMVQRMVCEAVDRQIEVHDLPEEVRGSRELAPTSAGSLAGLTMEQVERLVIEKALESTAGNREQAAKLLNIGTRTLYRKIKEFGL